MKIALATDHAGFSQANELALFIDSLGHESQNFGPKKLDLNDDYPDFIFEAAKSVDKGNCQMGIILGGSGQGEAMAANRYKGVRCAVYYGPAVAKKTIDVNGKVSHDPYEVVRLSRKHNDANMLSIAARFVSLDEMKNVIKMWLETDYAAEPRHARRIKKLHNGGT